MGAHISRAAIIVLAVSFVLASVALSSGALADLTCSIRTDSCNSGETDLLHLYDTDGSHAELHSQDNYNNLLCCDSSLDINTDGDGDTETFLMLSGETNAHVEKYGEGNYETPALISSGNGIPECMYEEAECTESYECLVSISGKTNAHVGDCSAFSTKVCCRIESTTFGTISYELPTPADPDTSESPSATINVSVVNKTVPIDKVWVNWDAPGKNPYNETMELDFRDGDTYYYTTDFTGLSEGAYTFTAYANGTNGDEISAGERTFTVYITLSVDYLEPTPEDGKILLDDSIIINATACNKSTRIDKVWVNLRDGANENYTLDLVGDLEGNCHNYYTVLGPLENDPFEKYDFKLYMNDTFGKEVNSSRREATLTALDADVEVLDYDPSVPKYVKDFDVTLNVTYYNLPGYDEECYYSFDGSVWTGFGCPAGTGLVSDEIGVRLPSEENGNKSVYFNVTVDEISNMVQDWELVDNTSSESEIKTPLEPYQYEKTNIDLEWEGEDPKLDDDNVGSGLESYTLQYRIEDEDGTELKGWTNHPDYIQTASKVASDISLTSLAEETDDKKVDGYTFYFRTLSADRLGNQETKTGADVNTTVFFPKYAEVYFMTEEYGNVPISGGMTASDVSSKIAVKNKDLGMNVSIHYSVLPISQSPDPGDWNLTYCDNGGSGLGPDEYCNASIGPVGGDRKVLFWIYSEALSGPSRSETSPPGGAYWKVYLYEHPLVEFQSGDLSLTIGSHHTVPLKVRNILNEDGDFTFSFKGFFGKYAKFLVPGESGLGYGDEWETKLNRQEERQVEVEIAAADIDGSPYELTVEGVHYLKPEVNSNHTIEINVLLPAEFPGLNWIGIMLLFVLSAMVYFVIGTRK